MMEAKKVQQVEIALKTIKMSNKQIVETIFMMDKKLLTEEILKKFIDIAPS